MGAALVILAVEWPIPPNAVPASDAVRNPIDVFIRVRLAKEQLAPSPPADRPTLLRRVTLDLTGLPPTPDEVARVSGRRARPMPTSASSIGCSLRRATASGWQRRWLDAARYADTHGYQSDGERIMWRWRDWVIEAFNANMPFDQFTIEQLAGDLLPDATLEPATSPRASTAIIAATPKGASSPKSTRSSTSSIGSRRRARSGSA